MNLLLVGALTLAAARGDLRRPKGAASSAFVLGLFAAHHWMSAAVFAGGLGLYYVMDDRRSRKGAVSLVSLAALLLPLSVYLYLPIRAVAKPLLNWEDPSNAGNFLWCFFRRGYVGSEVVGSAGTFFMQLWHSAVTMGAEFGVLLLPPLLAAFVYGLWSLRGQRPLLAFLVFSSLGLPLVLSFYLNLPEKRLYLIEGYILTAYPAYLAAACAGFSAAWRRWGGKRAGAVALSR